MTAALISSTAISPAFFLEYTTAQALVHLRGLRLPRLRCGLLLRCGVAIAVLGPAKRQHRRRILAALVRRVCWSRRGPGGSRKADTGGESVRVLALSLLSRNLEFWVAPRATDVLNTSAHIPQQQSALSTTSATSYCIHQIARWTCRGAGTLSSRRWQHQQPGPRPEHRKTQQTPSLLAHTWPQLAAGALEQPLPPRSLPPRPDLRIMHLCVNL